MKAPIGPVGGGATGAVALDLTPGGLRRIKLLFYEHSTPGQGEGDTLQNRVTMCWTRDTAAPAGAAVITHCELRFSNGYATSITATSDRVHYERRLHTRENYTNVIEYHVTAETEGRMQAEARRMAADDTIRFNYAGFMWNFVRTQFL